MLEKNHEGPGKKSELDEISCKVYIYIHIYIYIYIRIQNIDVCLSNMSSNPTGRSLQKSSETCGYDVNRFTKGQVPELFSHLSHGKKPLTFHHAGWFIGILISWLI